MKTNLTHYNGPFLDTGVEILTFGGKGILSLGVSLIHLWVSNSYFWGLVFLRWRVRDSSVGRLVFLRLGHRDSYVLGLVFLCLWVSNSYVWGLAFLRPGVRDSYG